jgi:Copper type II ascorbate-dependent monooxygenase, C-terminal domain/Copper type II ascorbate-dependent monooxygenase, N-terminal domain
MRRTILLLAVFLVSFGGRQRAVKHPEVPQLPAGTPTFSKEVVRIFQQNCQSCHRDGDIAPFSLVDYANAKPHATLIRFMTQTREMPPWKPADGCGDFADTRKLSQADIDTIAKWVDAGAPEGNRADLPTPLDFSSGWTLGQPDLILKNPEPYTPAAQGDTYRCFTLPTNTTSVKHVAAVDTHPGDRQTVHHVLTFIDATGESVKLDEADPGPGYTCFGGPGINITGTLGGWAPGSRPMQLPADVGFELPARARIVVQVHYHPHHGQPEPDQTEFGIYFTKAPPKKSMLVFPLINNTFTIPPHTMNYEVKGSMPLFPVTPVPLKVWFVAPHMHLLGRKMRVEMTNPATNASQCLINIEDWDFNWQGSYRFKEPITIPAGTRLTATAFYDNTTAQSVSWGEATTDEMCIAFLGVTVE